MDKVTFGFAIVAFVLAASCFSFLYIEENDGGLGLNEKEVRAIVQEEIELAQWCETIQGVVRGDRIEFDELMYTVKDVELSLFSGAWLYTLEVDGQIRVERFECDEPLDHVRVYKG